MIQQEEEDIASYSQQSDVENDAKDVENNAEEVETQEPPPVSAIDTMEHMPSTIFYRSFGMKRPTPQELRSNSESVNLPQVVEKESKKGGELGTFGGVFLRVTLNILSVVYYLRLGWVVGNLGLLLAYVMILISGATTILTTLSLSALVTNGKVKGGGIYFCVSRTLGADFGGTIGVVFSFATTFTCVLNTFGFIEVVRDLIGKNITEGGKFDIPIIGISLITVFLIVCSISLAFEGVLQYIIGALIVGSLVCILFGFVIPSNPSWTIANIKNNLYPNYQPGNTFWSIFGVFFPACTGIMAGANISGDLKNPQKSIPIGTLGAIVFTTVLYLITATILASAADRETLWNDTTLLSKLSMWKWFVYIGVLGASVSSVSGGLVGGPKIFQALCKDDILPKFFRFFAKGKKSTDDPVRGFVLAWAIVVISTFIFDDLNAVGKALSNFILISYAIVSLSALVGRLSHAPSWRPAWKYYHPITATLGSLMCMAAMFLIDYIFALVTTALVLLIFAYFHWSDNATDWGDFTQAMLYTDTIRKCEQLNAIPGHVKNYRPMIEYLISYDAGNVEKQIRNLMPFKQIVSQSSSLIIVSSVGAEAPQLTEDEELIQSRWGDIDMKILGRLINEASGFGKLSPNIVALSITTNLKDQESVFDLVGSAFDNNLGVAISRNFDQVELSVDQTWPIDIWWLSDDGGLLLLLGYLLQQHQVWSKCPLRCLTVSAKNDGLNDIQLKISRLLNLFRITAEVIVLPGIDEPPKDESYARWTQYNIPKSDDDTANKKIATFLRLREIIKENSAHSSVILCSLPIPRAAQDSKVWLATLDVVSDAMPPFIWAHGNNENVLTFLS
jgi:amino acid transporter